MSHLNSLPAELTIFTAAECRAALLSAIDASPRDELVTFDAAAVGEVDGAGVQLLVSLANALHGQERRLVLHEPSAALISACGTLGVAHLCEAAS